MGSSCVSCSVEVADYRGHNRAMPLVPYALTRPFLFGLDAEHAHELTLRSLEALQNTPAQHFWAQPRVDDPVTLAGLRFPNRIGLPSTAWGPWASASSRSAP
jgi:hypothetical protein